MECVTTHLSKSTAPKMDDAETLPPIGGRRKKLTAAQKFRATCRGVRTGASKPRREPGGGAHHPLLILAVVAFAQSKVTLKAAASTGLPRVRLRTDVDDVSVPTSVGHGPTGSESRGNASALHASQKKQSEDSGRFPTPFEKPLKKTGCQSTTVA